MWQLHTVVTLSSCYCKMMAIYNHKANVSQSHPKEIPLSYISVIDCAVNMTPTTESKTVMPLRGVISKQCPHKQKGHSRYSILFTTVHTAWTRGKARRGCCRKVS